MTENLFTVRENILRKKTFEHPLGLGEETLLREQNGQSRAVSIVPSCPLGVANHSTEFGSSYPLAEQYPASLSICLNLFKRYPWLFISSCWNLFSRTWRCVVSYAAVLCLVTQRSSSRTMKWPMESTSGLVPSKTLSKSAVNPVFFLESSIILPAVYQPPHQFLKF